MVRGGTIYTPPVSAGALEGITQDSIRTIAGDLGFDYEIQHLLRSDLYTADEAFLSGTAAEIVPIRSVDDRDLGEPGPITRRLQDTYFAAVRGEGPVEVTAHDGLMAVAVGTAAELSAREKRVVTMTELGF